ncbi:hypothetical protein HYDPIDRAFT_176613 [Hydnomerulius pinastri MD-312]|uniref:Unplaced genomic scaffold scaffold_22, whole genome shotgun sequence n=1 Tax=Hydnomerulius pinastri MD-312 TaxID=994086 RepID=A0A0C9WCM8_9AGAM|nr:hypothetical protein HYDPIDRAFT_176613 [Hydnomerulius pinastri MD-312]
MLTLSPGSVCDVCAEEFGPHCVPHSIPCGHVLCSSCCHKIVEKTLPRLKPVCPFCREHFTSDDVRLIRIDFSASGYATPRRRGGAHEALDLIDQPPRFPIVEASFSRTRAEARRLEDKVAKVAAKKCSVEEVSTLHRELQDWLTHDEKQPDDQLSSLSLSAALLRAILMNHFAHSEATKMAKTVEANLKGKLDDMELTVGKLEAELKQQQTLYTQKVQECQSLRAEISRFALKSATPGLSPTRPSSAAPSMFSESRRQSVSSSGASVYGVPPPSTPTPLSRFNAHHIRSSSTSVPSGSRPATPARTTTPAIRTDTPLHSSRLRPTSPVPPLPSKPRTMSFSATSPQKILRSYSDESDRDVIHERWMPDPAVAHSPPNGKYVNYPYATPTARSRSSGSNAA